MPYEVGEVVHDTESGEPVTVIAVTMVPATADLLGEPMPAHARYRVAFWDGRWAERREDELT